MKSILKSSILLALLGSFGILTFLAPAQGSFIINNPLATNTPTVTNTPTNTFTPTITATPTNVPQIWVDTPAGHGSSGTRVRTFSNVRINNGSGAITLLQDATNGWAVSCLVGGNYAADYIDNSSTAGTPFGITLNGSTTTDVQSQAGGKLLCINLSDLAGGNASSACVIRLSPGDVLRPQDNTNGNQTTANLGFRVTWIGN